MPATASNPELTPDEQALLAWLGSHDESCPACTYSLRSLTTPTCPECGAPLRLGVTARLNLLWWLVAVLAFALALGFDGVVGIVMSVPLVGSFVSGNPPPVGALIVYAAFLSLAAVSAVAIVLLIRRRPRWLRMPPARQRLIGITVFVVVGVVHAGFGISVTVLLQ